jgi:hypothetical protein
LNKFYTILLILAACVAQGQINPVTVTTDTAITKTEKTKSFYLKNPSNKTIQIVNIRTLTQQFYFTTAPFSLNPYDSALVTIKFNTKHNITYRDFFIFENKGLNSPIIYYLTGTAKYPDTLYRFTQGLIDEPLKTALRTFTTTGYISLGYNVARDKMFETVDDYGGDTIECVYIGRKIKATNRTEAQNQNFNTEHTLPQSFFNSNEPMVSDIFHLYPTDAVPNSARSNYAFGLPVTNITYDVGGSKLGKDTDGEIVFEPRDVHKGNVARSLFYFCVKYPSGIGGYMSAKQENILRNWNISDTVNSREILRNNRIQTFQNVRNPFIDHPELVERIKSTYTVIPNISKPEISASPFNVVYDTLKANDTMSYYVAVMNYGTGNLSINSATSSIPQFIIESVPSSVPQNELRYIKIKFKPSAINQTYNGLLTIQNPDSTITVSLKGFSNSQTGINKIGSEIPEEFNLYQNYPNPFNNTSNFKFEIANLGDVKLLVYDITGRLVQTLVNEELQPGRYEITFDGSNLNSGIFFYRLIAGNRIFTKKMILLK